MSGRQTPPLFWASETFENRYEEFVALQGEEVARDLRDPFRDGVPRPMRLERQTEQSLVEMDVSVDHARHKQRAGQIDPFGSRRRGNPRGRPEQQHLRVFRGDLGQMAVNTYAG